MSAAHQVNRSDGKVLSPEYLFWGAKRRDSTPNADSTTVAAIAAAIEHDGQPEEEVWPYEPDLVWRPPNYGPPTMTGVVCYTQQPISHRSIDFARRTLNEQKAPVLAMRITKSFIKGDIVEDVPGEPIEATHAVVAIGHGRVGAKEVFLIRNSWGEAWSLAGHALVRVDYLQRHLVAVLAVS